MTDLHGWITRQVATVERLLDENEWPPSQADGVRLRCEADRRVLARHVVDTDQTAFTAACEGCDLDSWGLPNVDNLNDCPELLDLAHAHGITDEILATLDRPEPSPPPPYKLRGPLPDTSRVPPALRGPNWKGRP